MTEWDRKRKEIQEGELLFDKLKSGWNEISLPPSTSHSILLPYWGISITFNNSSLRDTRTQTVIRRCRKDAAGTGQENICYYTLALTWTHSALITQHAFQLSWNISKHEHTKTHLLLFSLFQLETMGWGPTSRVHAFSKQNVKVFDGCLVNANNQQQTPPRENSKSDED